MLVTSGNGAAGLSPALAGLGRATPVLAVGDRTAGAMRGNGFADVRSAAGDQRELAALASATLAPGASLLIATGEDRKPALEAALKEAGFAVTLWVRYRARAASALPEPAREALAQGRVTHVVHYSRRAAETFAALAGPLAAGPLHLCLSADVAEGLAGIEPGRVRVASAPDEAHLMDLLPASGGARPLHEAGPVRDGAGQHRGTGPDMAAGDNKSAKRRKANPPVQEPEGPPLPVESATLRTPQP